MVSDELEKQTEFRFEEFKWQKKRFMIMFVTLALMVIVTVSVVFFVVYNSSLNSSREFAFMYDNLEFENNQARRLQIELQQRIEEFELRQRNLEEIVASLRASLDTNQELLRALRDESEQQKSE